jgi:hypothetical protein
MVGEIIYFSRYATPTKEDEFTLGKLDALKILADQEIEKEIYNNTPQSNFMKSVENKESQRPLKTIVGRYRKYK